MHALTERLTQLASLISGQADVIQSQQRQIKRLMKEMVALRRSSEIRAYEVDLLAADAALHDEDFTSLFHRVNEIEDRLGIEPMEQVDDIEPKPAPRDIRANLTIIRADGTNSVSKPERSKGPRPILKTISRSEPANEPTTPALPTTPDLSSQTESFGPVRLGTLSPVPPPTDIPVPEQIIMLQRKCSRLNLIGTIASERDAHDDEIAIIAHLKPRKADDDLGRCVVHFSPDSDFPAYWEDKADPGGMSVSMDGFPNWYWLGRRLQQHFYAVLLLDEATGQQFYFENEEF